MNSITIISLVVVALLTVLIFGLTWLGYSSCLKSYKLEVEQGKHDSEIYQEYHAKKKNKGGLIGLISSYLVLLTLSGLFVTGIVYKARGENFAINNQTVLVIKSGSMSDYYSPELATKYQTFGYKEYHFDIGDICTFEKVSTDETRLDKGEVYGYKYKNIIITHRLVDIHVLYKTHKLVPGADLSTYGYYLDENCTIPAVGIVEDYSVDYYELIGINYEFRGDNNPISDPYPIKRESIVYHYTNHKVPGLGVFILYAQSYFGIWSLVCIIGVLISSEIIYSKLDKINKERDKQLGGAINEK